MKYLILGNGVAGTYGAKAIREIDPDGEILIISAEEVPFYFRPRLPEVIAGAVKPKEITVFDEKWYENLKIKLQLKEKVQTLDLKKKTVKTNRGRYAYDRLLLALGSKPSLPPLPGIDSEGVFSLRTLSDALHLKKLGAKHKKAILIGCGLLGLEAAYGLIRLGVEVTLLENSGCLLPRQMDEEGAQILQKRLEKIGFKFKINAISEKIEGALGKKTLKLQGVAKPLSADFILVSAGIKSNLEIPQAAGIICNRGVIVNTRLETSENDVYAAGDLAEFEGRVAGIWPAGMEQGQAAGANMAGMLETYRGTLPSTSLKVAGIDLTSFGVIKDFQGEVAEYKLVNQRALTYAKIFIQKKRIVGGIFLGEAELSRKIQQLVRHDVNVSEYAKNLLDKKFDFSLLLKTGK